MCCFYVYGKQIRWPIDAKKEPLPASATLSVQRNLSKDLVAFEVPKRGLLAEPCSRARSATCQVLACWFLNKETYTPFTLYENLLKFSWHSRFRFRGHFSKIKFTNFSLGTPIYLLYFLIQRNLFDLDSNVPVLSLYELNWKYMN